VTRTAAILGLGTARPAGAVTQTDAADMAVARCCESTTHESVLRTLYRRTSVESRGSVLLEPPVNGNGRSGLDAFYPQTGGPGTAGRMKAFARLAPALAIRAARTALNDAAVDAAQITHVVVATCTGFTAPGLDAALVTGLDLPRTVGRVQVGFMGCHAAINALQVARAFAATDDRTRVLVCCVELCSLHFQYGWRADRVVSNALFADGAAAVVIGADDDAAGWSVADTASRLIDDSADAMGWQVGDHGFEMTLSPRVPGILAAHLRPWVDDWLATHGHRVPDVGAWVIHAGGPRIVDSVAGALDLEPEAIATSLDVLRTCGNMSSATVLFVLDRLRQAGATGPCVMLGFGPGLVAEAALLQ
jgi:predicted naringenin-chalcone synthase